MAPTATAAATAMSNDPHAAPATVWGVSDPPFEGYRAVNTEGYARSNQETAIVIDNGEPVPRL